MSSDWRDTTPPEARLKFRVENIESRLSEGARTFASIRRAMWWVVGLAVGSLGSAGLLIFRAGQFAEDSAASKRQLGETTHQVLEVKATQAELGMKHELLKKDVEDVADDVNEIKAAVVPPPTDALGRRKRK